MVVLSNQEWSCRPFPVANFIAIDALGVGVVDAVDDLVLEPFLDVSADGPEARNAVDDVNRQVEAIDLVEDGELERSVDVAFFLVAAHVDVAVICAAVREFVNERGVGVEIENDGLIGGEKRIEIAVGESVRMFGGRHANGRDQRR